ncbi:hypothetical protein E2542_SST15714 [Spatholobus suberectus]|nr:hypothetical protein E2542_SST15714 [Spatholobus suberectus]
MVHPLRQIFFFSPFPFSLLPLPWFDLTNTCWSCNWRSHALACMRNCRPSAMFCRTSLHCRNRSSMDSSDMFYYAHNLLRSRRWVGEEICEKGWAFAAVVMQRWLFAIVVRLSFLALSSFASTTHFAAPPPQLFPPSPRAFEHGILKFGKKIGEEEKNKMLPPEIAFGGRAWWSTAMGSLDLRRGKKI